MKEVTEVTGKQLNKYKSLSLITNKMYPNKLRNSSVANTVDQEESKLAKMMTNFTRILSDNQRLTDHFTSSEL